MNTQKRNRLIDTVDFLFSRAPSKVLESEQTHNKFFLRVDLID